MDFGASDAIEIVKCLGAVTWEQARYSLCFDSLIEELDQEKNKLKANVEDMNENVRESQENTIQVGKRLELDLKESGDVIKEVDELVKKVKPKKTCCHGPCPDLIWQYRLGRQVANKTEAMKQLNAQFQPQKLTRIQSLPGMEYYSAEDFIPFKSAKKASDELLKALRDPSIRRIGLYGMGGCGKTTLVKEVGKEAEKIFKKVVFVAVSSTSEVRKIQGSIADALKLTLKEENEPERAKRLYMRLSVSEKILIILDDVWEELNFEGIGIPFRDNQKGCRILLTTRLRGVCVSLKCHKMVRLDLLSEKEAWQLFKKHAGISDDASEKSLKGLPQVINKACKGLPVAIAAIASALRGKTLEEWKEACVLLKRYEQLDVENNSKDPYASLRLSYDHLKKKEAQDLFLLCSLFPEDSEIKEEDLIRMGTGLGLFEKAYSCDSARSIGGSAIRKLLDSFLLLQAKEGMSVMLHDILRAVALRIADKQVQTILEPTLPPSLMELPERVATEAITKLYCHNINEFPLQFKCPKLEILIVCKDGKGSSEVPDEFFNEMERLKVLTIINKSSSQESTLKLPKSIWSLKCLRTLCIRGCKLDFTFSLQQLEHLEILEFCNCSILQLPNDIVELKKLKMLDVSRCRVRGNPYKVLGMCPKLQELYFSEIDLDEEELKNQNLAEFFGKSDYLTKLERYNVQIGARVDKIKDDMKSGFLSIRPYSNQDSSISTSAVKHLVQKAEVLFLENIPKSCKNVVPDIVYKEGGCLNDLIELLLSDSKGIRCLIDNTNQLNQFETVFSNLHKLRITGIDCIEGFCRGNPPCGLFEQLQELECSQLPSLSSLGKPKLCNLVILKLESCPKLKSLFTPVIAVSLVLLEELKITKCHGLMYIIGDDKEEGIEDDNDQKIYGSVFKKLKELVVGDCNKLEYLIPLSFAQGLENLEILKIYLAPELKYAFGDLNHPSSHQNENMSQIINLPALKVLELLNLGKIISICPENYNAKFPKLLESHIVDNCPNLDTIMSTGAFKVDSVIEMPEQQDGGPHRRRAKLSFVPSGISIVAENIREFVYAPVRQARYSLSFNRYVEDLQTEKETLKFTRQSLQDRVEKETLEIDSDIKVWLVNADKLIEEAERLEVKAIANRSCCLGYFPNWIQRYLIGKQAAKKINAMIEHNKSREFQKFSEHASLEEDFQEDFIFFDSRKTTYFSLLESLKEDEISMIGLYGQGGCGKTTLAKQVAKEAEQFFDKVVFVYVYSYTDVWNIQRQIAAWLDWKLEGELESERAKQLFMRLANGERILIILDNIWDRLNVEDIGIPFGVNHKGCSVLITTRSKQVCIMMDCQMVFTLPLLTDEEAWIMFQKHAHITEDTSVSLNDEAKEVTQVCGRLPIAIAAVARTLKGKTDVEWKEALGLFFLCSIFPRDFVIPEEHLMRYGILLRLFGEVSSYERARNQGSELKEKLIEYGLLLKADEGQCVKMHDLFPDLALLIANKEKEVVALEGVDEWQLRDTTTLRYLRCENADKLPNGLDFPELEYLYLGVLKNSILPDEIFNGMKFLKVLILACKSYSQYNMQSLALLILSLANLVGLFLEGWKLGDISSVTSLNRLEALVLWSCSFDELSSEITELNKLRLLDLSECLIEKNPYGVIGRCSQLQELYFIGNSCLEWKYQADSGVAFFQETEMSLQLERYRIEIGGTSGIFHIEDSTSRGLHIEYFDASTSNTTVKNLIQRAEVLSLGKINGGCRNIIPDLVQKIGEGINELIELRLCNSDKIRSITDSIWNPNHLQYFFPRLTKLRIQSLQHMEVLCYGPNPGGSFERLKKLELYDCPLLMFLFSVAVAQSLVMLEAMTITKCHRLKHIILQEETTVRVDQKSIFPKLELLVVSDCDSLDYLEGHRLIMNLCSLKKLTVESCSSLEALFTTSTAKIMTSLRELTIERCSSLQRVFGIAHRGYGQALTLPRLEMLRFIELPKLTEVSDGFKLQRVINAVVEGCPNFRGPIDGFQNLSQGQNPELDSESEQEVEDVIGQSTARSQESSEVHSAKTGISNIINTDSSPGEVDAVHGASTNIAKEHRDVMQTSLNQDVAPLASINLDVTSSAPITELNQEYQTTASEASSSSKATAVQRSISNITREDTDSTHITSLTQNVILNGDQINSIKEMGSIFNLPMHHGENFENEDDHSGTAPEEPTLQAIKEPLLVQATPKIDQNLDGINFSKGEDSQGQEFDTSSKAENATKETSVDSVNEQVPMSEKYNVATSLLGGKDTDSQTATNEDVNFNAPLVATNSEYQTPVEEIGNQKMEERNAIEQNATEEAYNQIGKDFESDKLPKTEMITGVGGQLQIKGLYTSTNLIGTPDKHQEHEISPSIGEGTMDSAQKGLPLDKYAVEISSLDFVIETSDNQLISMDREEVAFEENKVSLGNMPTGLDLHKATNQHRLHDVNTRAGSSGKATLELHSSELLAQNVDITIPFVIPAPIEAPVSSVSLASVHAPPTEVDPMMCSSNGKPAMNLDEEYAPFRDIVAIKKEHIPLLEQAIASYPSLWDWHEKSMHPKMKQFGYTMLGDMLEFLASTKWRDLTEERKAEFQSLLDGLETLGFDTQWLVNTLARIKKSSAINRMKILELQEIALESELQKTKLELDVVRVEQENLNNFIGF